MTDAYRQVGVHAAAKKLTDLPVVLPTKYELVINFRTAKAQVPVVAAGRRRVIERPHKWRDGHRPLVGLQVEAVSFRLACPVSISQTCST
jgi:hypothetical protein